MRTIKFRAWDKEQKEMRTLQPNWSLSVLNDEKNYAVMQFTGLHDKNGKEIYEGDVVYAEANEAKYTVEHGLYINTKIDDGGETPDCYGWYLKRIKEKAPVYGESLEGADKYLEVIGNIYENPNQLPTPTKDNK